MLIEKVFKLKESIGGYDSRDDSIVSGEQMHIEKTATDISSLCEIP